MGVSEDYLNDKYRGMVSSQTRSALSVSDVVKLATGGVKIDFEHVKDMIVPDPPEPDRIARWFDTMPTKALVARIVMNARTRPMSLSDPDPTDPTRNFRSLLAAVHGDTVHVFVHYYRCKPQVMTDPVHLFPSDALMAQLHLLEEHSRTIPEGALDV